MDDFQRQNIDARRLPQQLLTKWSVDVLSEGFVPFPKKLLRTMCSLFGDTPEIKELAVILAVVDFKRPNLTRNPSPDFLAFLGGLTKEEFRKATKRLMDRKYASVTGDSDSVIFDLGGFESAIARAAVED